ncbi:MAG: hypothetical protein GWN62_28090 [Aliifodinibius sp.]|nr:hypothetical protein [Fodinibius sp.]
MRKKEYQVTDDTWIKKLLIRGAYGTIATVHESQPYITPVIYIYQDTDHSIYFHGARTGRLRANINFNPKVAFNVSEFGKVLSHHDASEFNITYNSVTVFGNAILIENEDQGSTILKDLLKKYAPDLQEGIDFQPIKQEEIKITAVYRIQIQEWTGKRQVNSPEYLDSFDYPSINKRNKPS